MKKASFILLAAAFAFLASSALAKYESSQDRKETHDAIRALKQQIKDAPECNAPNQPSDPACKAARDSLKDEIKQTRASGHA